MDQRDKLSEKINDLQTSLDVLNKKIETYDQYMPEFEKDFKKFAE